MSDLINRLKSTLSPLPTPLGLHLTIAVNSELISQAIAEIEHLRDELRLESKRLRQCQDGYAVLLEETDKLRAATKRCAVRPYCACQHADGEGCDTCLAREALGDDDG